MVIVAEPQYPPPILAAAFVELLQLAIAVIFPPLIIIVPLNVFCEDSSSLPPPIPAPLVPVAVMVPPLIVIIPPVSFAFALLAPPIPAPPLPPPTALIIPPLIVILP